MAWGDYPRWYNPSIHGAYDPSVYYGRRDTPFANVKLGELGGWLRRRDQSPSGIMGGISRGYWRWQHKYVLPKRAGMAPLIQVIVGAGILFYGINFAKMQRHRNYHYH